MFSKITSWRHNKIVAFALAVAVFLSAFYGLAPTLNIVEALGEDDAVSITEDTSVGYWDGDKSVTVESMTGEGNQESPKLIYNGAELYAAVTCKDAGVYFKLMKDIQLQTDANMLEIAKLAKGEKADESTLNEWHNATTNFSTLSTFAGNFDGNFKTISGLYLSVSCSRAGLFGDINGATLANFTIKNSYINVGTGGSAGVVAGRAFNSSYIKGVTVENCYIKAEGKVAGFVSDACTTRALTLEDCKYIKGEYGDVIRTTTTDTEYMYGALYADTWSDAPVIVANRCLVIGMIPVNDNNNLSGFSGTAIYTTVAASYGSTILLEESQLQGANAYVNASALNPKNGWIVKDKDSYPIYVGKENLSKYDYIVPAWDGDKSVTVESMMGEGNQESPKLIYNGAELYAAVTCKDTGVYFKLMKDIQLQTDANMLEIAKLAKGGTADKSTLNEWHDATTNFSTLSTFAGNFDGNFKTISGLYLSVSCSRAGLFGDINGATLANFTIKNSYINVGTGGAAGVVAGRAITNPSYIKGVTVENCYIKATNTVAGFVAQAWTTRALTLEDCKYIKGEYGDVIRTTTTDTEYMYGALYADTWSAAPAIVANRCLVIGMTPVNDKDNQSGFSGTAIYTTVAARYGSTILLEESQLQGANAYVNAGALIPKNGWIVKDKDSYPIYVGKENVSKYEYLPVPTYWAGDTTVKVDDMEGDGTAASPKLIYNGAELYAATRCTNDGIYFKLMNDIQLQTPAGMAELEKILAGNEAAADKSKLKNWEYTAEKKFNGKFDGNFKTITGMYISTTSTVSQGLFSAVGGPDNNSGTNTEINIANVTVKNAVVKGGGNAAALIGTAARASQYGVKPVVNITGCRVENCHIETTGDNAAGIMALLFFARVNVIDCAYIKGDNGVITSKTNKGSLHGNHHDNFTPNGFGLTVTRFLSVGEWPASKGVWTTTNTAQYYTPVIAYTDQTNASVGTFTTVSSAQMKGQDAYASMGELIPKNGWIVENNDSYPIYVGAENVSKYDYLPLPDYWTGNETTIATAFADQAGKGNSADTPYEIWNGDQLYAAVNSSEALYFKLMADIELQNATGMEKVRELVNGTGSDATDLNDWSSVSATFKGHFDGNFKTVSGLYMDGTAGAARGLFASLYNPAEVKNLTIKDSYYKNNAAIGGFAGVVATTGNNGGRVNVSGCRVENVYLLSSNGNVGGYFGSVHHVGLNMNDCLFDIGNGKLVNYGGKDYQDNVTAGGNCKGALCGDFYNMTGRYTGPGNEPPQEGSNYSKEYGFEIKNFISYGGYSISSKTALCNNAEQGWANASAFDSYGAYFETYTTNRQTDFTQPDYTICLPTGNNTGNKDWLIAQDVSKMVGAAAYENMPTITPARGWVVLENDGKPVYVGAENVENYDYIKPIWQGKKVLGPTGNTTESYKENAIDPTKPLVRNLYLVGEGTPAKPYIISTGIELYVALQNTEEGKVFSLMNDINLNNIAWNATASNFTGTINGNGYTISGLTSNNALVPTATTVTFNDLHLRDVYVSGWTGAGFVNAATGAVTFNGCSMKDFEIITEGICAGFILDSEQLPIVNNCLLVAEEGCLVGTAYGFLGFARNATIKNSIIQGVTPLGGSFVGDDVYAYDSEGNQKWYRNAKAFKKALARKATLANAFSAFYWDNTTDSLPMLKNASCAVANDVDGDEVLTIADAGALKGILLLGTNLNQVKTDNFDENEGIDILDVVALYNAAKK